MAPLCSQLILEQAGCVPSLGEGGDGGVLGTRRGWLESPTLSGGELGWGGWSRCRREERSPAASPLPALSHPQGCTELMQHLRYTRACTHTCTHTYRDMHTRCWKHHHHQATCSIHLKTCFPPRLVPLWSHPANLGAASRGVTASGSSVGSGRQTVGHTGELTALDCGCPATGGGLTGDACGP